MKKPLRVVLSGLKQGENHFEFEHEPVRLGFESREVSENPSFRCIVGPVRERVSVVRDGVRLLVRGRVAFRARLTCAVCGDEFEREFDEELAATVAASGAVRAPLSAECPPEDELRVEGDVLDLTDVVRDAVHLAVPMAPACRPDCAGLCPSCGAKLGRAPCKCGTAGSLTG